MCIGNHYKGVHMKNSLFLAAAMFICFASVAEANGVPAAGAAAASSIAAGSAPTQPQPFKSNGG